MASGVSEVPGGFDVPSAAPPKGNTVGGGAAGGGAGDSTASFPLPSFARAG